MFSTLRSIPVLIALAFTAGGCKEAIDDQNSEAECNAYCAKSFDCGETEPTTEQTETCVANCRDSIEDNCGNDNQAEANAKIDECVDLACVEFATCMVLDVAPECFDFVD